MRTINLVSENMPHQISMLSDETKREKIEKLETAMEEIRERFGKKAITYACLLEDLKMSKAKDEEIIIPRAM